MIAKQSELLPTCLQTAIGRFGRWRGTRKRGERIPRPLWRSAVKAAQACGVSRTSQVLRVDYYALKKRVEGDSPAGAHEDRAVPAFVELASPVPGTTTESVVELEDSRGSKLRIHVKGGHALDVSALCREFRSVEA